MATASKPRCIEVNVSYSGGGKVAIVDFGKHSSDWHVSMARRFEIPDDWTQDQIDEFQLAEYQNLFEVVDALDSEHMESRLKHKNWND